MLRIVWGAVAADFISLEKKGKIRCITIFPRL